MFGAIARGALGGTQLDHESMNSVPMQRGARSVFCRSILMQRGARFLIFGERSMAQHGVDGGAKNIYKTNAILHIFKVKRTSGASTKWIPKNKNRKTTPENECLVRSPGELLEAPNWTMKARKAFPCSAALVPFFAGAFPCSVALVF